ncbi:hypothetical protein QE443_001891 [Pantoea ananatis]|nr:hypothetical protein [Pantoea ananatis]MDR6089027.1 hypothetical protein [Pantoea ananatis]PWV68497.1 hypothetical protein C7425_102536 [Pantoea ananatis]
MSSPEVRLCRVSHPMQRSATGTPYPDKLFSLPELTGKNVTLINLFTPLVEINVIIRRLFHQIGVKTCFIARLS